MKLILSKSIVEVEEIILATIGVYEDNSAQDELNAKRILLRGYPFWLRVLLKVKHFIFGDPEPIKILPKKQYKISMTYLNRDGRFVFTAYFLTEKEALDEFLVVKDFAKRLENKHAMDIISK